MRSRAKEWIGTIAACAYLGVTLRTLYRLIHHGDIPPAYQFGRVIRLRRQELEEFMERSRIQPGELRHLYPPSEGASGPG